jgi:8-oxo-dGTP diphosphatase
LRIEVLALMPPALPQKEGFKPERFFWSSEETGLSDLIVDCFLGEHERDMSDFGKDEIHHRYFYHLRCEGDPPATWRHEERDSSDDPKPIPIMFELFWAPLIADHGQMIPQLLKRLS